MTLIRSKYKEYTNNLHIFLVIFRLAALRTTIYLSTQKSEKDQFLQAMSITPYWKTNQM